MMITTGWKLVLDWACTLAQIRFWAQLFFSFFHTFLDSGSCSFLSLLLRVGAVRIHINSDKDKQIYRRIHTELAQSIFTYPLRICLYIVILDDILQPFFCLYPVPTFLYHVFCSDTLCSHGSCCLSVQKDSGTHST